MQTIDSSFLGEVSHLLWLDEARFVCASATGLLAIFLRKDHEHASTLCLVLSDLARSHDVEQDFDCVKCEALFFSRIGSLSFDVASMLLAACCPSAFDIYRIGPRGLRSRPACLLRRKLTRCPGSLETYLDETVEIHRQRLLKVVLLRGGSELLSIDGSGKMYVLLSCVSLCEPTSDVRSLYQTSPLRLLNDVGLYLDGQDRLLEAWQCSCHLFPCLWT